MSIACPYCSAAGCTPTPQPVLDLTAKALGEVRRALEARARGVELRTIASAIVAGEPPPTGDRRCPYCRNGMLAVERRAALPIDLVALVLGVARLYWIAGEGRRLRWQEVGELFLDGRVRFTDEPEDDEPEDDDEPEGEPDDEQTARESWQQQTAAGAPPTRSVRVIPGNARIVDLRATDDDEGAGFA